MVKRRKSIIRSSVVAATVLRLGTVAVTLLSGRAALADQKTIPDLPVAIAPIKAPFEMPRLRRPSFGDVTFDIRDSYYEREATGKSPLFRNVYINNIRVNGAHTAIEMIGLPEKWLENINVKNARFENVGNGAIAHRVKELTLENVSIASKGRPIVFDDVFEATIKNARLSGQRPPLLVGGSESGAITIEGLNPDDVEYTDNVPRRAVAVGGAKLP